MHISKCGHGPGPNCTLSSQEAYKVGGIIPIQQMSKLRLGVLAEPEFKPRDFRHYLYAPGVMLPNMERWHECSQGFTENSYSVACWIEVCVDACGGGVGGWGGMGQVVIWINDTIFKASCKTDFISKMTLHASFSIYANSTFPFNSLSSETPKSSVSEPRLPSLPFAIKH